MNGKILVPVVKTGRCANGGHRDAGRVVHAALVEPRVGSGDWAKALCGTMPGRLSSGWERVDTVVTCPVCQKRIG